MTTIEQLQAGLEARMAERSTRFPRDYMHRPYQEWDTWSAEYNAMFEQLWNLVQARDGLGGLDYVTFEMKWGLNPIVTDEMAKVWAQDEERTP